MRLHSQEFKDKIKEFGRQLDSKITYNETVLGNEQLNAVTPVLQSSLLKSVMKELDIDSNVDIPIGTIINYKHGVKVRSGKNLLNIDSNSYNLIKSSNRTIALYSKSDLSFSPGTYTISLPDLAMSNNLYGLNIQLVGVVANSHILSGNSWTFTVDKETSLNYIYIFLNLNDNDNATAMFSKIQIEEGEKATYYEPYGAYEYLDYGNYQIYSSEKQEDNNAYNIVAYDKMLNSMVEYKGLKDKSKTFPMQVREYMTCLFQDIGIEFADKDSIFANYDKVIPSDPYVDLGYTYRDILDELAQVTASNIVINENDEAKVKYVNRTGDIKEVSSTENNIIVEDTYQQNARSLVVYGKSEQETKDGKNLFRTFPDGSITNLETAITSIATVQQLINYGKTLTFEKGEITGYPNEGNGTYYIWKLDFSKLKPDTEYTCACECVCNNLTGNEGNLLIFNKAFHIQTGNTEFKNKIEISFTTDSDGSYNINNFINFANSLYAENTFMRIYNIQLLEGKYTSETIPDYEPYNKMPSPELPSEIKCVGRIINFFKTNDITQEILHNGTYEITGNNSFILDLTSATSYGWSGLVFKIENLKKNTDYTLKCNTYKNQSDNAQIYTVIKTLPASESGNIKQSYGIDGNGVQFNSGNYETLYAKIVVNANATNNVYYFSKIQLCEQSVKSYIPYGHYLKLVNQEKNLFNINRNLGTPNNSTFANTTKRLFNYDTYINGIAANNYYDPSHIKKSQIENDKLIVETDSSAYCVGFPFLLKSGESYTVYCNISKETINAIRVSFYNEEGTIFDTPKFSIGTSNILDFNVPDGYPVCMIAFSTTANVETEFSNIQLLEGKYTSETIPDYESYRKNEVLVDLQNYELCSIENVRDELDIISGKGIKRIRKIEKYNGEQINTPYMSTTGELTIGATVYYVLETPQEFTIEPVQFILYEGINDINLEEEIKTEMKLTYQSEDDTIDEEYLKDINVKFGEKYGPINSIVLSRSAGADNVYLQDEQSVADNGLCELKISDNQIMNFNDRSDYLLDILNKLNGLEYYINDFSSTGVCYYEVADRYNVKIGENKYSCIMFNDEIDITQGLEENIHTDLPEQAETDYTKADKTDRRINQTYLIVDKQNQRIESVVSQVGEQDEKITQITQDVNEINQKISHIADVTVSGETRNNLLKLEKIFGGQPLNIKIYPIGKSISELYPQDELYPSDDLFMPIRILRFENTETKEIFDYELPDNLLYLNSNIYDEFELDYEKKLCQVIKRCGYDEKGNVIQLSQETIENFEFPYNFIITSGDYNIYLPTYELSYIYCRLAISNDYTNIFATKVEMNSSIRQTAEEINLEVSKKVDENEIISKINQTAEEIKILAKRISLEGLITANENFKVLEDGSIEAKNGSFSGNIYLQDGNKVIGGDGLYTNLQYSSTGPYQSWDLIGFMPRIKYDSISATTMFDYQDLVLICSIPDNFTIEHAYLTLLTTPINTNDNTKDVIGMPKLLRLYVADYPSTPPLYWFFGSDYYYGDNSSSLLEITSAFGVRDYTPDNSSPGNIDVINSIDIKQYLVAGETNVLTVRTSMQKPNNVSGVTPNLSSSANNTGAGKMILNIYGYMSTVNERNDING